MVLVSQVSSAAVNTGRMRRESADEEKPPLVEPVVPDVDAESRAGRPVLGMQMGSKYNTIPRRGFEVSK